MRVRARVRVCTELAFLVLAPNTRERNAATSYDVKDG